MPRVRRASTRVGWRSSGNGANCAGRVGKVRHAAMFEAIFGLVCQALKSTERDIGQTVGDH